MKAKSNKGKMPAGAPKGMNPLEFFRKGGEQRKAMYKKGGYNTPTQNQLPKRNMGGPGDDPFVSPSMQPKVGSTPNVPSASSLMTNPFVRPNAIMVAANKGMSPTLTGGIKPSVSSVTPSPTVTPTSTVSSTPSAPVTTSAPVLSAKERIKQAKADAKIAKIEAKANKQKAKQDALAKRYETGDLKPKSAGEKLDQGMRVVEMGLDVYDKVNQAMQARKAGQQKRGGAIKPKASKGMIVKSKRK